MALNRIAVIALFLAGCGDCRTNEQEAPLPSGPPPAELSLSELEQLELGALRERCENAPGRVCAVLGERLRNGEGESEQARLAFEAGCLAGDGSSCLSLGRMWRTGQGGALSNSEALRAYRSGCEFGEAMACNNAGILLRDGQGIEQDPDGALTLFESACRSDYWVACDAVGRLVMVRGEQDPRFRWAKEALERACIQGEELLACVTLAEWSLNLDDDLEVARRLYSRACNFNDVPACVEFARMLHTGAGGPVDQESARQLLDMGCRRGVLTACVDLAEIHESGAGVEIDIARAEAFRRHACESGLASACPTTP